MATTGKRGTKKAEDSAPDPRRSEQRREILGVLLIFLAAAGLFAFLGKGADRGLVVDYLRAACGFLAGRTLSFLPLVYLLIIGIYLIYFRRRPRFSGPWLGWTLLFLVILTALDLIKGQSSWDTLLSGEGGGFLGAGISLLARAAFRRIGAWLFLGALAVVSLVLITGRPLITLLKAIFRIRRRGPRPADHAAIPEAPALLNPKSEIVIPATERTSKKEERISSSSAAPADDKPISQDDLIQLSLDFPRQGYKLPALDLLNQPRPLKVVRPPADQRRQLEETLSSFGVQAKVIEVHRGPVITRYDLQPAPGVKVSRIVSLADDLALALAARGLRIEAPIPGKAALGIEVPNREATPVILREVLESKDFAAADQLVLALGRDIGGEVVLADLNRMPHLLVAGATGSGKSVCLNAIIMSLLYKSTPERLKFIMIDPKMVELTAYNGIPHLIAPVVTDAKRAPSALKWAVTEMEGRYRQMMEAGCREITAYNRAQTKLEAILPYIVIVIDELADLMMIARLEVEDTICRLAQMARATGIHLVIATQRPSVDVITGLIKANIPSRIAFAVSSVIDSRTILDSGGAERLLGRGDMLYSPVGVLKPRRVQGALVDEDEIERVVAHWQAQVLPAANPQPPVFKETASGTSREPEADDDLFWDAVQIVVENQQASASILQRKLRVGYARAARLVDLMEAKGFVGRFEGSKPREVRLNQEELAAMREK